MGLLKQLFGGDGEERSTPSQGPGGKIGSLVTPTDSWQDRARALTEAGRRALEEGEYGLAVSHLLDSVRLHESRGDDDGALRVSPFLGAALYGHGRKDEAISVLEETVSRGSDEKLAYELLVSHYEEAGLADEVARVRSLSPAGGEE